MTGRYTSTISVRVYARKSFTFGTPMLCGLASNATQTVQDRVATSTAPFAQIKVIHRYV
jgi:hypothetical protein